MTRKQAEQRALELYPKEYGGYNSNLIKKTEREAYLQCWDDLNEQQEQKSDTKQFDSPYDEKLMDLLWEVKEGSIHPNRAWKRILPLIQPDQLREAAEKVVDYALYGGLGVNLHDAICELEKELNQKKQIR